MKKYHQLLTDLNADIWDYAELKFEEYKSSQKIMDVLQEEGFDIQSGLAGIHTAFTASYGNGKPVIGILGEFDALSGLSQKADFFVRKQLQGSDCGHGCGHSLLGTAAVGAALKIRDYLVSSGASGTVVMIGCPAEEGGSGKAFMARDGVFDQLDLAMTWHPSSGNVIMTGSLMANIQAYYRFTGISSHAAATPHLGRSALDAVEIMNIGVNYMREHMEPTDRIHYAVTDTGGISPNVVQGHAEVVQLIRSTNAEKTKKLYDRVEKIAQGASLITETQVEVVFDKACSNTVSNSVIEDLLYDSMVSVGVPIYTPNELEYAGKFKETLDLTTITSDLVIQFLPMHRKREIVEKFMKDPMADFIIEHEHLDIFIPGSSDVGDVSHVVPTAQFSAACFTPGTPAHSWQMVAQGKSDIALKGMFFAAEVLADAAVKVYQNPEIAKKAKKEFDNTTGGQGYNSPIPPEVKPNMNAKKDAFKSKLIKESL